MVRKIIFWAHLVAGVAAGVVILMMSVTGVLLTYEYQMIENSDMKLLSASNASARPMALEEIIEVAGVTLGQEISGVVVRNDDTAPYQVTYDRRGTSYIDPYSGENLGTGAESIRNILAPLRSWHRWFNVNGEGQDTARAITGASNVIFFFIVISGIYLWLPSVWNRASLRMRLWFKMDPGTSKVRDYNWHHVFSFWSLIPLVIIVATAIPFSYPGVRNAVTGMAAGFGDQAAPAPVAASFTAPLGASPLSLDALVDMAKQELGQNWRKITVNPAADDSSPVRMSISLTNAIQPTAQENWTLNPYSGEILTRQSWKDLTLEAKVGQFIRRGHTGELWGVAGQTIVGLVSIFACFLVWTGFALAWRRLISPLFAKA